MASADEIGGADPEEEGPRDPSELQSLPPRSNPALIGHAAAEQILLAAHAGGRMHHAWLMTGPRGIGKATLAFRFARYVLAGGGSIETMGLFGAAGSGEPMPSSLALAPDHPVFRRVAAGGHADLLTVERGMADSGRKLRSEIVVDDTRAVAEFLRKTPAEGGWRVVIIDSADEMNRNAANALLKILEEPPKRALLLLVCHNPGSLLPTIRSRCRRLVLSPLGDAEVGQILKAACPDLSAADAAPIARLSGGSAGRAVTLALGGGLELYRAMSSLLATLPRLDAASLHALADGVSRPGADEAWRTLAEMLLDWVARMIGSAARPGAGAEVLGGEAALMRGLAERRGLDQWVEVWDNLAVLFARAEGVNLDHKQVMLNAFLMLEAAAR
jgi:DNA polymerase-3 subunit delta'